MTLLKLLLAVTIAEAVSWLGLVIAMIAKYVFDLPRAVSIAGPIHGMLFMAFLLILFVTHIQLEWSIRKTALSLVEAIPPFTGFLLARQLADDVKSLANRTKQSVQAPV